MKYDLNKYGDVTFRANVTNSTWEHFFVAQKKSTGHFTVFGPTDIENDFEDLDTFKTEKTAIEHAAACAVERAISIERGA